MRYSTLKAFAGLLMVFLVLGLALFLPAWSVMYWQAWVFLAVSGSCVISSGPYAIVRHPMYAGALVMLCGVPLALASWFGVPFVVPMVLVIVWRLDDEERFLHDALPGYPEYCTNVRYRLLPGVW